MRLAQTIQKRLADHDEGDEFLVSQQGPARRVDVHVQRARAVCVHAQGVADAGVDGVELGLAVLEGVEQARVQRDAVRVAVASHGYIFSGDGAGRAGAGDLPEGAGAGPLGVAVDVPLGSDGVGVAGQGAVDDGDEVLEVVVEDVVEVSGLLVEWSVGLPLVVHVEAVVGAVRIGWRGALGDEEFPLYTSHQFPFPKHFFLGAMVFSFSIFSFKSLRVLYSTSSGYDDLNRGYL